VFLDRDGTLNTQVLRDGRPYPPQTLDEFQLFPGVAEACRDLHRAGFVLIVATNQPDVGRGTQQREVVEAMHARLREWIPELAGIYVSYDPGRPGDPVAPRRKPEPGMLLEAAANLGLDLSCSWMIGDRWRDVDCGQRAGVRTVFIDFGYHERQPSAPDFTVRSFAEAAGIILAQPETRELNSKSIPPP
jgi:D-glycero-D-manno-heptose 1,7-bisphosphate phosphatase